MTVHYDCHRFLQDTAPVFHWDNNSQPYRVPPMTCSGVDTCCQDHMRYTLLDPNRADKYQEDSLALYEYLSNAIEIYRNEKKWFLYSFTKSNRILPKV